MSKLFSKWINRNPYSRSENVSFMIPYGMNESLRQPPPREPSPFEKLRRIAERVKEPSAYERAKAVGDLLRSRAVTGNAALDKIACGHRGIASPRTADRGPDRDLFDRKFADALSSLHGKTASGSYVGGGFGAARKMTKGATPATARTPLPDAAFDVMNQLSTLLRQNIVAALTSPTMPDEYRWSNWITVLRSQIDAECKLMGINPDALLDSLDGKFFDPMVQDAPFELPADINIGAAPPFRDTNSTRPFATGGKLARRENGSPEQFEAYALAVVHTELPTSLKCQVVALNDVRKRLGRAEWQKVKRDPVYQALVKAIGSLPRLTNPMRMAALSLIH
jgi:hypothetical protein